MNKISYTILLSLLTLIYVIDGLNLPNYFQSTINRTRRQTKCVRSEYQCKNGECIDRLYLCDGQMNCGDGSDELFENCRAILCPDSSFTFRCNYGACISNTLRCNGAIDCVDGSDEEDCESHNRDGCPLPEHIRYGRFEISDGSTYLPKKVVPPATTILLGCDGDENKGYQSLFYCLKSQWRPSLTKAKCRKPGTCPSIITSLSEEVICKLNGYPVSCEEPIANTTATVRCQPFYTFNGYRPIYKCQNGTWDQLFTPCHPDCGIKSVGATILIIGGNDTIKNEYPWVAAVYNGTNDHICAATIISRYYVISAAHCFSTSEGKAKNITGYTIIAGKHNRDMHIEEQSAQRRKVKVLHIHEDYRGKLQKYRDDIALLELETSLFLSYEVQPICMDWDNVYEDFDFIDGKIGVVTGWGNTRELGAPSPALKKLLVPYRARDVCLDELPKEFQQQFYTSDKICAGYRGENANVCSGDSGGGLFFKSDGNKFYIRGIVSIAVKSKIGCDSNHFALYTKVSRYLPWIEITTRRVL